MRHSSSRGPALVAGIVAAFAAWAAENLGAAAQEGPPKAQPVATQSAATPWTIDRFSAVTADMTPKDVSLNLSVLSWSDGAGRAAVVAALGTVDPTGALLQLPTLGYLWLSSSPVGLPLKYAVRTATPDGGERLTFVTDKRLDYYAFDKWRPAPPLAAKDTPYGVVELYLDPTGHGTGTLSLVADVKLDAQKSNVSLADGAPRVLTNATAEHAGYAETRAGGSAG